VTTLQVRTKTNEHPLDLPAAKIASGIRDRQFSCEEVVGESIRRAERVNARLNAFTTIRQQQALEAARDTDHAIASGKPLGPLAGVPFAAKDLTPTAGDVTTRGSLTTGNWIPTESALVVRRLEQEGAILVAKTTTPEFAYSSFTYSPRWGITRNPWDESRTPGGSSGGSAVAVATGVVPFAEGTDMGGSVRIPAAFCGVVGMKPSLGRIPMTILPSVFDNISHFGPLARTVADAITFMEATCGPSDEDISSLPIGFDSEKAREVSLRGKRFAMSVDLGYYHIETDVKHSFRSAITKIRDAGATVDEIPITWTRNVNDQWFDLWCVFMAAFFGTTLETQRDALDPNVAAMMSRGLAMNATTVKQIELLRTRMWQDIAPILRGYDAFLCPTCALTAPLASQCDDDYVADNAQGRFVGLDMTCPFNMLPQLPVLSLPIGLASTGLPVGMQIVGPRFADERVLSLAAAMERHLGVLRVPSVDGTP